MNVVVLISGSGSNLQAIIDNSCDIGIKIKAVISNKADAYGVQRAAKSNIKTEIILSNGLERVEFDKKLVKIIDKYNPELILLAGFMRVLTNDLVDKYAGKILNIHPSLLPKFKGLNTHQRALDAGEKVHGATVHLVSCELDSGYIIMQKSIAILVNDNAKTLADKVLKQEHILYPLAIKKFIESCK